MAPACTQPKGTSILPAKVGEWEAGKKLSSAQGCGGREEKKATLPGLIQVILKVEQVKRNNTGTSHSGSNSFGCVYVSSCFCFKSAVEVQACKNSKKRWSCLAFKVLFTVRFIKTVRRLPLFFSPPYSISKIDLTIIIYFFVALGFLGACIFTSMATWVATATLKAADATKLGMRNFSSMRHSIRHILEWIINTAFQLPWAPPPIKQIWKCADSLLNMAKWLH